MHKKKKKKSKKLKAMKRKLTGGQPNKGKSSGGY
jgi:hypothetical protein|tara:strand:+ start:12367 stop:12468 length:102 start_codon:yes stop_codon:yes gene_type:complete